MAPRGEGANCVIGENSVFEGRFFVNGSILIEGKFEGAIKTNDHLTIGPTGKVKTDIVARRVTVAGTLIGNIVASEEVVLLDTGRVLGNISTPRLTVQEGVVSEGKVTITDGNAETVSAIIKDAFGPGAEQIFATLDNKPEPRREKPREPKQEPKQE